MEVIKNDICIMSILYQSGARLSAITSGAVDNMLLVKTLLLLTKKKKGKRRRRKDMFRDKVVSGDNTTRQHWMVVSWVVLEIKKWFVAKLERRGCNCLNMCRVWVYWTKVVLYAGAIQVEKRKVQILFMFKTCTVLISQSTPDIA